jgi:hypothetical protein
MNPYKFTPEVREKFLELLRNGHSRKHALETIEISRYTLINHMKDDPEFAAQVHEAMANAIDDVEDALYEKCMRGHAESIKFFLCNRASDRWAPTNRIQIEGSGGIALEQLEKTIESLIEYAIRFIPDDRRQEFFDGLRSESGIPESDRPGIAAPSDS